MSDTTIPLREETKNRLYEQKDLHETWDDVLRRLAERDE